MKTKPRRSQQDRSRRKHHGRDRHLHQDWGALALGGPVDPVILRRTVDAFSSFDPGGPWSDVASRVLPLLKRLHHPFPPEAAPIHLRVPPGLWAGFGVDVGPAWAHVSRDLLERWGTDEATLLGAALDNLRRRIVDEPPVVETTRLHGVPITAIQAQGWGSAIVLAPDRLEAILGPTPRILLAPVRNTLLALPHDVELEPILELWAILADGAADELDVGPLEWTGSAVVGADSAEAGRPN